MRDQIRRYRLKPDTIEDFLVAWRRDIVPLRAEAGFSIPCAWHDPEENEFLWVLRWHGEGSFEEGDQAYYDMPKRAALPRQFDWVESQDVRMFDSIDPS